MISLTVVHKMASALFGFCTVVFVGRTKVTGVTPLNKVPPILRTILGGGAISNLIGSRTIIGRDKSAIIFPSRGAFEPFC